MKVLVDTCVWSLALHRSVEQAEVREELADLIEDQRIVMIGPIRQELLSEIRHQEQLEKIRLHLRAFPDLELETADYEMAASFFNACRAAGLQGSNTDFLICAVAHGRGLAIHTVDQDFERFAKVLPITLHQ